MRRNLIWLNLVLVGLLAAAGVKIRDEWLSQQQREQAVRRNPVRPTPAPASAVPPTPAPVAAASYGDIAQKMLFAKDRNPIVAVEVPVVVVTPPEPMPALPSLRGVMGLPSGMVALMSEAGSAKNVGVRVGDKIGPFELIALTPREISLRWKDKTVTKNVSSMIHEAVEVQQAVTPLVTQVNAGGAAPPPGPPGAAKPGAAVIGSSDGSRTCDPSDPSPAGTVADGMRKVLVATPFGNSCHWEPAK